MLGSRTAPAGSPYDAVYTARDDCRKQAPELQRYLRYLWHPHVERDEELRNEFRRALAFHVNSLSTEPELVNPYPVGDSLWRVNILDYGWKPEVWARLADVDPYFHADLDVTEVRTAYRTVTKYRTEQVQYYGRWYTNQVPYTEQEAYEVKETKRLRAFAPWLPPGAIKELSDLTASKAPILRADWFVYQTAIQAGRKAGYYDFLGVKDRNDVEKLAGLDRGAVRRLRKEVAALVSESGVALQNRQVLRFQSITGGYWFTLDAKTSVDKQNALELLDDDFKHDAEEIYFVLPNELFGTAASDAGGKLADTVPDNIAADHRAGGNDRRIHPGLSCFRCHEEGLQEIDDFARKVYAADGPLELRSPDYAKLRRLRQLYLSDLPKYLARDKSVYAEALKRVNGLGPKENAAGYAKVWARYADRNLGPEEIAAELGVPEKKWVEALKQYGQTGGASPILLGLLVEPPKKIRREHWEEKFPLAMEVLASQRATGGRAAPRGGEGPVH
jgi:hypothetical protein